MKRLRLLGLMLMAVFALGATTAATASASERGVLTLTAEKAVLAVGTNEAKTFTITAGGSSIRCGQMWILHLEMAPVAGSGEKQFNLSSKDVDIHISECTSAGVKCNTEGDTAGVLLVLALAHLINLLDKAGGKLVPGFAWVILNEKLEAKPMLVLCGLVHIQIRGAMLGLVEPLNAKKEATLTEEVKEAGFEAKASVVCDKENEKVCEELQTKQPLEANFGAGFVAATITTQLSTLTFHQDVLWDD
jgi:hypothetical protein